MKELRSFILKQHTKHMKYFALTLGTCAAAFFAPAYSSAQAQSFSPEQKKELEKLFLEFLADNPQAILDSVDNYRAEQERQSQQSAQENLDEYADYYEQSDLPMAGNPDGDVTVVEYFDYNCGYCRKAFEDIMKLLEKDDNIRVVFQEMPILSPSSQTMAQYALAAHQQGKYFEMHKALMNYKGSQSEQAYQKLAEDLGLDMEKLKADLESEAVTNQLRKSMEMARSLGIRGTPGFIVGDKIYPGYIGLGGLTKAIQEARANSSAEE